MFLIFTSVWLLFLFQSTFPLDIVSDKESLTKSLIQVDKFLDKVEKSIHDERDYIRNLARRQSLQPYAREFEEKTRAHEDLDALFSDRDVFKESTPERTPKYPQANIESQIDNLKDRHKHPNFLKAIAALDDGAITASTVKLSLAISDLKNLVKNDIDIKSERNAAQAANEILRQLKDKLNGKDKNETKLNTKDKGVNKKLLVRVDRTKAKNETKDDLNSDFDIFNDMDFPTQSGFPVSISLVTTTPTPEIMKPNYMTEHVNTYAEDFLKTETPTTDKDEVLLDPTDFGYRTTHVPISTYGDISDTPIIPHELLTTTPAPDDFVKAFRNQMKQLNVGVFSVAMLKIFEFAMFKEPQILRRMSWGLARLFESYENRGKLDEFGEPSKDAIRKTTNKIGDIPMDELKSYGITMHNAMLHRREMFSKDVNSIVDYIDSLYLTEEAEHVIASTEKLDQFNNQRKIPYKDLISFVESILAPMHRLQNSPKGEILKESLNRGIRNHFYPDGNIPEIKSRRQNSREKVKEDTSGDETNVRRRNQRNKKEINDRRNIPIDLNKENELFWKPQELSLQIPTQNNHLMTNGNIMRTKKHINHRMISKKMQTRKILTDKHNNLIMTNNVNQMLKNDNMNSMMTNTVNEIMKNNNINSMMTNNVNEMMKNNINNMMADNNANNVMTTRGNVIKISMSEVSHGQSTTAKPWTRSVAIDNRKLVLINKNNEVNGQETPLKMSSGSKRHHKKHRHTHARLKHKVAKIVKFIKQFQPSFKSNKHNKHQHKHRKHKYLLRTDDKNNEGLNIDKIVDDQKKATIPKDRRFQETKPEITINNIPADNVYDYTTQFYEVNRINLDYRRGTGANNDNSKVIKRPSIESDEEQLPLKIDLYKVVNQNAEAKDNKAKEKDRQKLYDQLVAAINDDIINVKHKREVNNKWLDEDEERALIRSRIYNYFRHKYAN